jgi:hypothetical protein
LVLAAQKDYERAKAGAVAEIEALAGEFEASFQAQSPFFMAPALTRKLTPRPRASISSRKIVALPTTDTEMMRLKARIYLWSEATDFKIFATKNEGDGSSEGMHVSLFRDLGADHELDPVLAIVAKLRAAWHRLGKVIEETKRCEGPLVDEVHGVLDAAKAEFLETPPTTLAGARAAIAWTSPTFQKRAPNTSGR